MANDWVLLLPELFVLLGALILPFVGFYAKHRLVRPTVALTTLLLSMGAVAWMLWGRAFETIPEFADRQHTLFGLYEVTTFALFFKFVFLLVPILVVLVSNDYLRQDREPTEYYALMLIATFGMMVVASARDLITLFVGLETAAFSSYGLVAFRKTDAIVTESATKFFIIGSLSSAIILYGISLVYAVGGTVDLYELGGLLANNPARPALLLAVAFLIAGLGFEISTVPFHMWAPDVYQGSPDTVSAFLAAGTKKMGFAAIIKIFIVGLIAFKLDWELLIGVLAVITMTVGNLAALNQTSMKRLLAWSSIAQAGYILIALPVGTSLALGGALFHILTHAVMKGGAFVLIAVLAVRGVGDSIDEWRGIGRRYPLAGFTLAVIMLSLAGIPPLAGFVSKFILFASAVDVGLATDKTWLIGLAVAGVLNSALSLYYYARVIRALYVEDTGKAPAAAGSATPFPQGAVWVCFIVLFILLVLGVFPDGLVDISRTAASSLLPATTLP